ncbi:MAG: extracellular solute-binding protein [Alphaproteobacteria bacterium]|nr:extracellular solute-binding protein [Alphaproteobacteria bacterium]
MNIREFRSRIANHDITRRQAYRAMAAVGIVSAAQPVIMRPARAGNDPAELMSFTWAGYDIPEFAVSYIAKHGVSPQYSLFSGQGEASEKLRAGFRADVAHPCSNNSRLWFDKGLTKAIDTSRLSNWADIWPELDTLEGVRLPQQNNQVYLAPADWGNTSICYRPDMYPADVEESWTMILDPERKGRITVNAETDNLAGVSLAIGINPYTMTDEQLALVKQAMIEQRELVRFYWESATEIAQAMAGGEVDVAVCWNETAVALKKEGVPVKFAYPKEGIIMWVCGLVISSSGEADESLIYDFIDSWMSPEAGAFLINDYGYGHSNRKSFDLVPPERLAELGLSDVKGMMNTAIFSTEGPVGMRDKWRQTIEDVMLGT